MNMEIRIFTERFAAQLAEVASLIGVGRDMGLQDTQLAEALVASETPINIEKLVFSYAKDFQLIVISLVRFLPSVSPSVDEQRFLFQKFRRALKAGPSLFSNVGFD